MRSGGTASLLARRSQISRERASVVDGFIGADVLDRHQGRGRRRAAEGHGETGHEQVMTQRSGLSKRWAISRDRSARRARSS